MYNKIREPKFGMVAEHLYKRIRWKSHSDISITFWDRMFQNPQFQEIISKNGIEISEWDFERIFFHKCSARTPNFDSLTLL